MGSVRSDVRRALNGPEGQYRYGSWGIQKIATEESKSEGEGQKLSDLKRAGKEVGFERDMGAREILKVYGKDGREPETGRRQDKWGKRSGTRWIDRNRCGMASSSGLRDKKCPGALLHAVCAHVQDCTIHASVLSSNENLSQPSTRRAVRWSIARRMTQMEVDEWS